MTKAATQPNPNARRKVVSAYQSALEIVGDKNSESISAIRQLDAIDPLTSPKPIPTWLRIEFRTIQDSLEEFFPEHLRRPKLSETSKSIVNELLAQASLWLGRRFAISDQVSGMEPLGPRESTIRAAARYKTLFVLYWV